MDKLKTTEKNILIVEDTSYFRSYAAFYHKLKEDFSNGPTVDFSLTGDFPSDVKFTEGLKENILFKLKPQNITKIEDNYFSNRGLNLVNYLNSLSINQNGKETYNFNVHLKDMRYIDVFLHNNPVDLIIVSYVETFFPQDNAHFYLDNSDMIYNQNLLLSEELKENTSKIKMELCSPFSKTQGAKTVEDVLSKDIKNLDTFFEDKSSTFESPKFWLYLSNGERLTSSNNLANYLLSIIFENKNNNLINH